METFPEIQWPSKKVDKFHKLVDYSRMQRVGTLLDDFNKEIARTLKIHKAWAEIAGEVLAAHTEPVHLKGGTLTILCDAPLWAQQVGIMSASLCEQIRKLTGFRVKTCEGRFGRVRKAAPRRSVVRQPLKPAIDPRVIERIKDPELKARVQALLDITEGRAMKMNRKTWAVLVIAFAFCVMAGLFLLSLRGYLPLTYTQADTLKKLEAFLDSPRDDMRGVKANGHFLEIGKRRALQVLPGYKDVFYLVRPYRQVQYRPRNMTRAEVVDLCLSISGPDLQSLRSEGMPRDTHWRGVIEGREVSILRVTRFTYLVGGLSEKPITIAQVELAKRLGMSDAEVLSQIIPVQLEWLRSLDASATRPFSELILPEVPDRIVAWLNARA